MSPGRVGWTLWVPVPWALRLNLTIVRVSYSVPIALANVQEIPAMFETLMSRAVGNSHSSGEDFEKMPDRLRGFRGSRTTRPARLPPGSRRGTTAAISRSDGRAGTWNIGAQRSQESSEIGSNQRHLRRKDEGPPAPEIHRSR
jgi:hypothetical protein